MPAVVVAVVDAVVVVVVVVLWSLYFVLTVSFLSLPAGSYF